MNVAVYNQTINYCGSPKISFNLFFLKKRPIVMEHVHQILLVLPILEYEVITFNVLIYRMRTQVKLRVRYFEIPLFSMMKNMILFLMDFASVVVGETLQ